MSDRVREMLIKPLIPAGVLAALLASAAGAENLEAGKSAAALFGLNCAACHASPHGLAKDADPNSLVDFLRQHYTSSPETAGEMAAYLNGLTGGQHRATSKLPPRESEGPAAAVTSARHGSSDGPAPSEADQDRAGTSSGKRHRAEDPGDEASRTEQARTRPGKGHQQPGTGSALDGSGREEATPDESSRPPADLPFAGPPAESHGAHRPAAVPAAGDDPDLHSGSPRGSREAAHAARGKSKADQKADLKGDTEDAMPADTSQRRRQGKAAHRDTEPTGESDAPRRADKEDTKGESKGDPRADLKGDANDATPADTSQRRHHGKAAHRDTEPAGESDTPRRSHSVRIPSGSEPPGAKPTPSAVQPVSPHGDDSTAPAPSMGAAASPAAGSPAAGPANQTAAHPAATDQPTFSAPSP